MLPRKPLPFLLSLAVLLSSLTACANGPSAKNLEKSLAADPTLQNNHVVVGQPQPQPTPSTVQLPTDFPKDIPVYPNAKLEEVRPASATGNNLVIRWESLDPSNVITSYYRSQLQANNWQILPQPTDDSGDSLTARRQSSLLKVDVQAKSVTNTQPGQPQTSTELLLEYIPNSNTADNTPQSADGKLIGPLPTTPPTNTPNPTVGSPPFEDLTQLTPEWQQHIQDLAANGVFSGDGKANKNNFEPGKIISRREYALWLLAANNAMYANDPAKQIRLASAETQPVFPDITPRNPDFASIQGLAEAGIIPSSLSGDTTAVLFRPDAPLTREQLVMWKVPLDIRQGLPAASLDTIKQTWGFQDAGKIDPQALRAILADFQNGEQSNIRRVFGYTTLFQPKKPVTRAEAAVALWYFGTQGEGISAAEALKLKSSPSN